MFTEKGAKLVFRLVEPVISGRPQWEDYTEFCVGNGYTMTGRFIEIQVKRNFRVTESKSLNVDELD